MSPNKKIFCNTPWYELHIYWDGSFGICCQESHKLYADTESKYNIATMSLSEWFNSEPVRDFRLQVLGNKTVSACSSCYREEEYGGHSRRIRSNQKSIIFAPAFESSFTQSPGYKHFKNSFESQGYTGTHPIDLHIDLGNYCNLACKMCNSEASSTIASQHIKWGIVEDKKYLGTDWTRSNVLWENFKKQLLEIPNLNNIHFMGGETLLTKRFHDLVDTLIDHQRFDLCLSFVTNGTVYDQDLVDKLKLFRRVGMEISIETVDERNSYVRQGTNTNEVLLNIQQYKEACDNNSISVTLRPAPSFLTLGTHVSLLDYALDQKFLIKSSFCNDPVFLSGRYLPTDVKQLYQEQYKSFVEKLNDVSFTDSEGASNPENYQKVIKQHALTCLNLLQTPTPPDSEQQMIKLVEHCKKWDKVYHHDARKLYPELMEVWDRYGY